MIALQHFEGSLFSAPLPSEYWSWTGQAAGYDVVTMDTETGRKATRDALGEAAREAGREPAVVQGNFDPRLLSDNSPMSGVNVSLCFRSWQDSYSRHASHEFHCIEAMGTVVG